MALLEIKSGLKANFKVPCPAGSGRLLAITSGNTLPKAQLAQVRKQE